ncbi:CGNR zinc finger domain-containing protein [Streptomyces cinereoruber]|uniref:CGNR zinc finger domain-containing protein n=1 Tax=Streptomyces cinereoruber TaxID=67260 RepID=UPI0036394910
MAGVFSGPLSRTYAEPPTPFSGHWRNPRMTDQPFEGLTRNPDPTSGGLTRNRPATKSGYAVIRGAVQQAREAAWLALDSNHPAAGKAYESISEALALVDAVLFPVGGCAGPECTNPVPDKGIGRPARYCSPRCKDRAAYRARKERAAQRKG